MRIFNKETWRPALNATRTRISSSGSGGVVSIPQISGGSGSHVNVTVNAIPVEGRTQLSADGEFIKTKTTIRKINASLENMIDFKIYPGSTATMDISPVMYDVAVLAFFRQLKESGNGNNLRKALYGKYNTLTIQDLHKGADRYLLLIGEIGSGKTVLLRRYARMISLGRIECLNHIAIVVFLSLRSLDNQSQYLWDFIFGDICPDIEEDEREPLLRRMIKEEENVIFIFDCFDACTGFGAVERKCGYYKKSLPMHFVKDILNGHLFKKSKILMSSREVGIQMLPEECLPDKLVVLGGFNQREWIREKVVDDAMLEISSNPLTLREVLHSTVAGVETTRVDAILDILRSVKSPDHKRSNELKTDKLSKMSFIKIVNGKYTFDNYDLRQHELSVSDVTDVMFGFPYRSGSRLWKYTFVNRPIAEFFASLFVVKMSEDSFIEFMNANLEAPLNLIRFTFAIICNEFNTNAIAHFFDMDDFSLISNKRDYLLKFVGDSVLHGYSGDVESPLKDVLDECDEAFNREVEECLKQIHEAVRRIIDPVVKVIREEEVGENDKMVDLSISNMAKFSLNYLTELLEEKSDKVFKVRELCLNGNPRVVCGPLGKIIYKLQVEKLSMDHCEITKNETQELEESLNSWTEFHQVQRISLNGNPNIFDDCLAKIFNKFHVEWIFMRGCDLKKDDFTKFVEALDGNMQLKFIDMRSNKLSMEILPAIEKLMPLVCGDIRIDARSEYVPKEVRRRLHTLAQKMPKLSLR